MFQNKKILVTKIPIEYSSCLIMGICTGYEDSLGIVVLLIGTWTVLGICIRDSINTYIPGSIFSVSYVQYSELGYGGSCSTGVVHLITGQQVDPASGAWFVPKFISLAHVVPGPV